MMTKTSTQIKVHHFAEHPVIDYLRETPTEFDISSEGTDVPSSFLMNRKFCIGCYCERVFQKVMLLDTIRSMRFLKRQCSQVKQPIGWLNDLDIFIEENYDLINSKKPKM